MKMFIFRFSAIILILIQPVFAEEIGWSIYCKDTNLQQDRKCPHIKELAIDLKYNGLSIGSDYPSTGNPNIDVANNLKGSIESIIKSDVQLMKKLDSIEFSKPDHRPLPKKGELIMLFDFRTYNISEKNILIYGTAIRLDTKLGYTFGSADKLCEDQACVIDYLNETIRRQLVALGAGI